jgi:hypothetical protein
LIITKANDQCYTDTLFYTNTRKKKKKTKVNVRKPCKGQKWGCLCHPGGQVSEFPFEDSEHGSGAVAAELPPGQHTFFAASDAAVFTPSTTVLTTLALTWPLCGGIFASDFFSIALNNEVTEAQQTLL